jgi:hypothetical protein
VVNHLASAFRHRPIADRRSTPITMFSCKPPIIIIVLSDSRARVLSRDGLRSMSASMKPIYIAATLVACAAIAATQATERSRRDIKILASEMARGLIGGIILGVNVGPYLSGLIPAHIESRVTASGYAPPQPADSYSVADE